MLLMEYVTLGKVIDAFNLDGTLKIISSTFYAEKRYKKGNQIDLVYPNGNRETVTVVKYRHNKDIDFVKVEEINTKEEALERKGCFVEALKDNKVLNKGDYYFSDLEKCDVYDSNGCRLGKVKKVEEFPSCDTLRVVRDNGKDFFVPFVKDFIISVDIENQKIIINVIEGML